MSKQVRIEELEANVTSASLAYYNDVPTVTDAVYDAWRDELSLLKPDSYVLKLVGAPAVGEWLKVRHLFTMGSLDKVQSPDELVLWAKKVQRTPGDQLLVTEKLDGISISLRFEDGLLVQALTRGDGTVGEDITPNVRRMKGVPKSVGVSGQLVVRGEILLLKEDHKNHFSDKANPRNAASGISKRLNGKGSEHLSVVTYQIVDGIELSTEGAQFQELYRLGFKIPSWSIVDGAEQVGVIWERYQEELRDQLPFEIDGLVIRLNDLTYQMSLGDTHGRPNGAVAFKFSPPARETTARDLIWQVGGTGRITPVAVFDAVNLLGAEVTRASLYNQAYIDQIGFDIGAKILVARANDVIPRVSEVLASTGTVAKAPSRCPVCSSETARDGEYVVCQNVAECPAQVTGRLKQWIAEQGVLEWGEALLQKLVDQGLVRGVADLYKVSQADIAGLDRMAQKSAENAYKALWASSPMTLENLLGGLSIPLCATSTITLITSAGYDSLDKIGAATVEQLQAIPGVGPKRAQALSHWFRQHGASAYAVLAAGVLLKSRSAGPLSGKSVCFTGKSERKRAELEKLASDAGALVKSSVGKGLTYLVLADPDSTSSKAVAARENGTTCISEASFVAMCGG
jgi:DNA ligase (NAD+)